MNERKFEQIKFTMFGTNDFPTYEEIVEEYAKEFNRYITPKGDTIFGFWMQTLADLELLDLELQGLTEEYKIDPINRTVEFKGGKELIKLRVAHLEKVNGENTLYTEFVDLYGDTNAYAFHNLYPFKGKFYPREKIKSKYLGMKNAAPKKNYGKLPSKVLLYYEDLKKSIENMYWVLKPGGKIAIIVGDSTVNGEKIPTTMMTKKFCEEVGFNFKKLVFNPLLGARNRAIRGESIIICEKK